ncbi:MAG: dienelactone hydrolase family protein [Burkholderiales bacterium]
MQSSSRVQVSIPADGRKLQGELIVPGGAAGIVAFAHGSGSSRHSPRNQFVARELQQAGLATLLLDLLEEEEAEDRSKVFDIGLLALRLLAAARWLGDNPGTHSLALGYFGASTGAAAALLAAARDPGRVSAVVSRGGRPDLAMRWLPDVKAPTLLIVGEDDEPVLQWNRDAYARLSAEKELVVVPRATHLFEEPGALEEVARHACRWFVRHLSPAGVRTGVSEKARR